MARQAIRPPRRGVSACPLCVRWQALRWSSVTRAPWRRGDVMGGFVVDPDSLRGLAGGFEAVADRLSGRMATFAERARLTSEAFGRLPSSDGTRAQYGAKLDEALKSLGPLQRTLTRPAAGHRRQTGPGTGSRAGAALRAVPVGRPKVVGSRFEVGGEQEVAGYVHA